MTADAYLTILGLILVTLIAACIAAGILAVVGEERLAWLLGLPWDER